MELKPHLRAARDLLTGGAARRREILRSYYFAASRPMTPVLLASVGGMRFFVSTDDDVIGREVFRSGGFDLAQVENALRVLRQELPDYGKRPLFVDVGANIGTTTVAALSQFGFQRALAVEPEPSNFELLELNVKLNHLDDRVTTVNAAISDHLGTVPLARAADNSGDHRVAAGEQARALDADVTDVRATTLDALLTAEDVNHEDVGVVWIDVQGHEGHVLAGAPDLLARRVPAVVEFWPQALRQSNGFDLLVEAIRNHFTTVVDLGSPYAETSGEGVNRTDATEIVELERRYPGGEFGDLLLLP